MHWIVKSRYIVLSLAMCFGPILAWAQDSTVSREAAADRYLRAVPVSKTLDDVFSEMAKQLPQDQRAEFMAQMNTLMRMDFLERAIRESMIKTYTADELNALAAFYGSEHGASAMRKLGVYMSQVMPAIQSEVQRGLQQRNAQQAK